ncbi:MAG: SpoIIIAH-like family protein [Firmicutes bacterium]|nr:SpoIIIAH-like family protein [Bacillota bacterium]
MGSYERASRQKKGRVVFLAFSRPEWVLAGLLALAVALAASWALRTQQKTVAEDGTAVPAVVRVEPVNSSGALGSGPQRLAALDAYRLERERMRARRAELLQAVVNDPDAGEDRQRAAQEELLALWEREGLEREIEQLLLAQGISGVVVLGESGAHVVVDAVLDAGQAARIGELVSGLSGVRREAIAIVDAAWAGR